MLLMPLLRSEYDENNDPRSGHRAYHECRNYRCGGRCKDHVKSCSLNFAMDYYTEIIMARSGKKSKSQAQFSTTFVRYTLTAADKKAFAAFCAKPPMDIDSMVNEALQANHKVSFSYSEHNDSYIVSVTGKPEECDNASKCFTSHAKTYSQALWVAMFKYHVIWNKGVWEDVEPEEDFG